MKATKRMTKLILEDDLVTDKEIPKGVDEQWEELIEEAIKKA